MIWVAYIIIRLALIMNINLFIYVFIIELRIWIRE